MIHRLALMQRVATAIIKVGKPKPRPMPNAMRFDSRWSAFESELADDVGLGDEELAAADGVVEVTKLDGVVDVEDVEVELTTEELEAGDVDEEVDDVVEVGVEVAVAGVE